jgi:peptide/nickel transport system substrate-binding protein
VGRHRCLRRLLVVLAVAAVLVAALGAAAGAAGASSPGASASPGSGKVIYKVGILAEPDNLNPFIGYLWSSFEIWYLTYDPLVGYDYGALKPIKGEASPGLATDWVVSDDGKTWTFTIRSGAKWQDGVPLTARDVAFTYNYIIKNNLSSFTSYVDGITEAVALDDTHVRFDCARPKANMLRVWVPIVPEHIWSKVPGSAAGKTYPNKTPYVGSGPFKAVEWKKNSYVKLVANPDYWRGRAHIDELYFDYYTNADTMVQDLKAGVIDGATGLLDAQYRQLKSVAGIEARTIQTNGFDELAFNCYTGTSRGNPVLKDAKFRQALNWAVDKAKIAAIPYGGHAVPATTVITADYYSDPDWHWQPAADQLYGFDIARAGQLMDAAGYKDTNGDGVREDKQGKPIKLRLWARSESQTSQNVGKLMTGWFKQLGLTIEFTTMEEGSLTDRLYDTVDGKLSPDYDMFLWGWYSDLDPDPILSYFTTAQIGSWSDCGWSDAEYDKLYDEQSSMLDDGKRKEIIDRMQQILYEESPYVVTVYSNDLEAFDTAHWEGYKASPAEVGNMLFPPYGNAGNENYLLIRPKTATTTESSGGASPALWAGIAAAVVVVLIALVVLLRRRRPSAEEE